MLSRAGKEVPQLIDELPILSIAGVLASGKTTIRHAEELRVKETDRIAAIAHNLRTMGAQVAELSDGLEIYGPAPLHGARLPSFGDHRIAMAFLVFGLAAGQPVPGRRGEHEQGQDVGRAGEGVQHDLVQTAQGQPGQREPRHRGLPAEVGEKVVQGVGAP